MFMTILPILVPIATWLIEKFFFDQAKKDEMQRKFLRWAMESQKRGDIVVGAYQSYQKQLDELDERARLRDEAEVMKPTLELTADDLNKIEADKHAND